MSNIDVTKITNAPSDPPIPIYRAGDSLLLIWLWVAVGIAHWVTERTGNTINAMSTVIIIINNKWYIILNYFMW